MSPGDPAARPVLTTARLRLRQFGAGDLDALAAIHGDAETMRYIGDGSPVDREGTWRVLAWMLGHWELRGYGLWAVDELATGALVGRVGLINPEGWPGLEIGWLIARPYWGRGFATEAATAVRDHAFAALRLRRLISIILPGNAASVRVALKLGSRLEGPLEFKGHVADLYALDASAAGH